MLSGCPLYKRWTCHRTVVSWLLGDGPSTCPSSARMVADTGFEPVTSTLKEWRADRCTNLPLKVLPPEIQRSQQTYYSIHDGHFPVKPLPNGDSIQDETGEKAYACTRQHRQPDQYPPQWKVASIPCHTNENTNATTIPAGATSRLKGGTMNVISMLAYHPTVPNSMIRARVSICISSGGQDRIRTRYAPVRSPGLQPGATVPIGPLPQGGSCGHQFLQDQFTIFLVQRQAQVCVQGYLQPTSQGSQDCGSHTDFQRQPRHIHVIDIEHL